MRPQPMPDAKVKLSEILNRRLATPHKPLNVQSMKIAIIDQVKKPFHKYHRR